MKRTFYFVIGILLILNFTLSGCWNKVEPKDLAITDSALYDLSDDGTYKVTLEFMNMQLSSGGSQSGSSDGSGTSSTLASGEGDSVRVATAKIATTIEKEIFGGHNYVRFFSEAIAKKDMGSLLDYFSRAYITDETPLMVVIKGDSPENIYSTTIGLADTIGVYFQHLEKNEPKTINRGVFVTTLDFIKAYYTEGKQPVAGTVDLVESSESAGGGAGGSSSSGSSGGSSSGGGSGSSSSGSGNSEKKYEIKYQGLAAFKDLTLVGYLNDIEARAYNFIIGNIKRTYIPVASGDNTITLRVTKASPKIKTSIEDNQIGIDVAVKVDMDVVAVGSDANVMEESMQQAIEQAFNEQMKIELVASIQKAQQEFKSDIFGFGAEFHAQHPQDWQAIKDLWDDEYFSKATVNVSVNSAIHKTGQLTDAFVEEDAAG